ncbi:MAG TPA: MBOAT family O-acyltransferase [Bacteroidales bacterium]|nr:MBOAT family O-acyltransferase [Bacteroidales bacterium]
MLNFSLNDFLQSLLYHPQSPLAFNTMLFVTLFTLFYLVYVFIYKKTSVRNVLLLLFSLYFYYKISGVYVVSLVLIASSDFFIGKLMFVKKSKATRRNMLLLSLFINIGLLIFFKYTNFFLNVFFGITTGEASPYVLNLITPVGISYFVFKTLSYIIDIYKENINEPEKNYINYLLYVSFFPNILSGPILRASDLLPQFKQSLNFSKDFIGKALFLIIVGVFKKVVIADFLGVNLVDRVFESHVYFSSFEYLMAGYGYLVQLYFDFSGYTDMVIGIAMLLGFTSTPNFNKPFLAQNVSEFWRRWHITLSNWLRDYIFNPMSIRLRNLRNAGLAITVLTTFIICGLWHGANYTFLVWGTLHGLIMGWEVITRKQRMMIRKKVNPALYKGISIFITFHVLMFTFIIFRAPDIQVAADMLKKIVTGVDFSLAAQWFTAYKYPFFVLLAGILLHYTPTNWNTKLTSLFGRMHWTLQGFVIFVAVIFIYQFFSTEAQPFIYLNF